MKKRVFSLLLSVILISGVLSACQTTTPVSSTAPASIDAASEGAVSDPVDSSTDPVGGEPAKFDDVRLKMLLCWNGGTKTAPDQYNNAVANKIRDEIGVTVEFEGIMMSETEKLNLMFASGDMPDMISAPYWGGDSGETQVIKKAATEGRLLPLEELIQKYENIKGAFDLGVVSQVYLERDLDDPRFEGHRYVIPHGTPGDETGITNWAYGAFVRGDVPEALGIDASAIKTADELLDFMIKARDYGFKDINGNDIIVATTYHEGWSYDQYALNFDEKKLTGDYTMLEDGTVGFGRLTENWVEKHTFLWKLVNENLLDKECFKHSDSQADEKVGNGTALFAAAQYSAIIKSTQLTGLYNSNPEMRYVPVGPMTYQDGSQLKQVSPMGMTGSAGLLFPTTCSNIEAALTYVNYINSEEGLRLCQYGMEGETYNLNESGQPRLTPELIALKQGNEESFKEELRADGIGYMHGNTLVVDRRFAWWGEMNAGDADAAIAELEAYRLARPVERLAGYAIDGVTSNYENYDVIKSFAFEGTTEKDYRERAYFAATEEEARQILLEYQTYLSTQENGEFLKFMEFVNEQMKTRDDMTV